MSLTLYFHPLSSFCQKVLIGLYELDVPCDKFLVDLNDPAARAAFLELWPIGKFPVLKDAARAAIVPETTIILEYLETYYGRGRTLVPKDPDRARDSRLRDRFFDLYVNLPLGKIVTDKLRPEGQRDPLGVQQARQQLETAYDVAEGWLRAAGPWAAGETFSVADCAAAPALFYSGQVLPFGEARPNLAAYFARLSARASFARVLEEAKPYLSMFPG